MKAVQRILVALDDSPQSRAALHEAAQLAARLHADLEGVFVLDTELLRLGDLPIACETDMISTTRRAIDTHSMERTLQRQAERAQDLLERAARQHQLRFAFKLSRGNVASELLAAAANADLLALGRQSQTAIVSRRPGSTLRRIVAEAGCSLLFPNHGTRTGHCVVTIFDGSEDALTSLSYALHIARRRDMRLTVLLCGPGDSADALRKRAMEALSATAGEPMPELRFDSIAPGSLSMLPERVARLDGGLLVLPRSSTLLNDHDRLLRNVGCPVLLTK